MRHLYDRVSTNDGNATIIEIDSVTHSQIVRYRLKFDEPDPYLGYNPFYDDCEVYDLKVKVEQLHLNLY